MYNSDFLRRFSLMGTALCAAPNFSICHCDKLACIYCSAHMIYMYTYFVLTYINSCFVHAPPRIAGAGHPCSDRSLFILKESIPTHELTLWISYCDPNPLLYSTLFYNFLHASHVHNYNPLFVLIADNIFVIYLLNYLFNIKT